MNLPPLIRSTLACFAAVFLPLLPVSAQDAVTIPRGIYTVKVPGATGEAPVVRTYLGIQLMPTPRFVGLVTQVSGNTLVLQSQEGRHQQLDTPARKSHVHVLSGAGTGFVTEVEQFNPGGIVCSQDVTDWIKPGDRIRLRTHPTISELLGATNRFGLGTGTEAADADNVVIWDPETQQERVYYFHSTRQRWEEKDVDADAGNAAFRFPHGFYIVRRSPGTLRIALSGEIGSDPVLLPVRTGANVFSLPVNLSGSLDKIVRMDGPHPVQSGPNASSADILTFEEPITGLQRGPFYHSSDSGDTGWREVGVNDSTAAAQRMDFLSTLILRREGEAGHVLVEGSLEASALPLPPLPPDPEPGEIPLTGELPFPIQLPADAVVVVEISTDLQTWTTHANVQLSGGKATFDLPSGQHRAFYRLRASLN